MTTLREFAAVAALAVAVRYRRRPQRRHPATSTANGINYYYEISGKGEPLLLLHGGSRIHRTCSRPSCRRSPSTAR